MFYLSELEHTLRVPPHLLNLPLEDAIKLVLQDLFLDKVWSLVFCFFSFMFLLSAYYIHTLANFIKVVFFYLFIRFWQNGTWDFAYLFTTLDQ